METLKNLDNFSQYLQSLNQNEIEEVPQFKEAFNKLTSHTTLKISLAQNQVEDISTFEKAFTNLTSLQTLNIYLMGNQIKNIAAFEKAFTNLTSLTKLQIILNLNQIEDISVFEKAFTNLTNLTSLTIALWYNQIKEVSAFEKAFTNLTSLTTLTIFLQENEIQDISSFEKAFTNLTNLTKLDIRLWENQIKEVSGFEKAFTNLTSLKTLNFILSQNNIEDISVLEKSFTNLTSLTKLVISFWGNKIKDISAFEKAFINLTSLTTLRITYQHQKHIMIEKTQEQVEQKKDCGIKLKFRENKLDLLSYEFVKPVTIQDLETQIQQEKKIYTDIQEILSKEDQELKQMQLELYNLKKEPQNNEIRLAYLIGNWDYDTGFSQDQGLQQKQQNLPGVKKEIEELDELNSNDPNDFSLKKVLERFDFNVQVLKNVKRDSKDCSHISKFGFEQLYLHIKEQISIARDEKKEIVIFLNYQGHGFSKENSPNDQYALCYDYTPYNLDKFISLSSTYEKCLIIGVQDCCRNKSNEEYFNNIIDNKLDLDIHISALNQSYYMFKPKMSQQLRDQRSITSFLRKMIYKNYYLPLSDLVLEFQKENNNVETQGGYCSFTF